MALQCKTMIIKSKEMSYSLAVYLNDYALNVECEAQQFLWNNSHATGTASLPPTSPPHLIPHGWRMAESICRLKRIGELTRVSVN